MGFFGRKKRNDLESFQMSAGQMRGERAEASQLDTRIREAKLKRSVGEKKAELRRLQHPHIYSAGHRLGRIGETGGRKLAKGLWSMGKSQMKRQTARRRKRRTSQVVTFRF